MNPNHFLAVAIDYLLPHRPGWRADAAVGKTLVQLVDDRPGRRGPRPAAAGGAGRLQVVRARACSTARWPSAARRAPGRRSCAATARSGPPTRTASSCPAGVGDPGGDGPVAVAALPRADRALRRPRLRAQSTRRPPASRRRPWPGSRPSRSRRPSSPASRSPAGSRTRPGQRRADRRAQGHAPRTAGSPRGRRAPRTSTRSTPSRSAAPSTSPRIQDEARDVVTAALA